MNFKIHQVLRPLMLHEYDFREFNGRFVYNFSTVAKFQLDMRKKSKGICPDGLSQPGNRHIPAGYRSTLQPPVGFLPFDINQALKAVAKLRPVMEVAEDVRHLNKEVARLGANRDHFWST